MVAYTNIKGGKVQNFNGDPSDPFIGQVWYNTSSGLLKVRLANTFAGWASVSSMNTARSFLAGAGTNDTASLAFGGSGPTGNTESWNGTSWTEVNDLNTARSNLAGCGTNTAALGFGGGSTDTETWNGTSWTVVNGLNVGRARLAGCGSNTQALAFGAPSSPVGGSTEEWSGPAVQTVNITVS